MRRKTKKSVNIKRKKVNTFDTIQKLEKEFLKTPGTLVALLNKEVTIFKQKTNNLKKSINQLSSQIINLEKGLQASEAKPTTARSKKQAQQTKRNYLANVKAKTLLTKQLKTTEELLQTAMNKHAKLTAFSKHINQFEKEWSSKSRKVVSIKSAKQAQPKLLEPETIDNQTENITVNNSTAEVIS